MVISFDLVISFLRISIKEIIQKKEKLRCLRLWWLGGKVTT